MTQWMWGSAVSSPSGVQGEANDFPAVKYCLMTTPGFNFCLLGYTSYQDQPGAPAHCPPFTFMPFFDKIKTDSY